MNNNIKTKDSQGKESIQPKSLSYDQVSPQNMNFIKNEYFNKTIDPQNKSQYQPPQKDLGIITFSQTSDASKPFNCSAWDDIMFTKSSKSNNSIDKGKSKEKSLFAKNSNNPNSSTITSLETKHFQKTSPGKQNYKSSYDNIQTSKKISNPKSRQSHQAYNNEKAPQSFYKPAYLEFNKQNDPSLDRQSGEKKTSKSWSTKPNGTDPWQNISKKTAALNNNSPTTRPWDVDQLPNKKAVESFVWSTQNNVCDQDTSWLQQDLNSYENPIVSTDNWDNFVLSKDPSQAVTSLINKRVEVPNWIDSQISTELSNQENHLSNVPKSVKTSSDWDAPIKVVGSWLRGTNLSNSKSSDEPCSWEDSNGAFDPWLQGPQMHDPHIQVLERMPWHYRSNEAHFKRDIYEHDWTKKYVPDPTDKTVLYNRWKIIKKIGFGGFGTVFYARDILDKDAPRVAIKREPPIKNSFLEKEAEFFRLLENSPNIPKLHHYGILDNNHIMVVDLLGPTLKQLVDSPLRLKLSVALEIGIQMIAILKDIHSQNIVYRDVKPENILLDFEVASYFDNTNTVEIKKESQPLFFSSEQNDYELPLFSSDIPISKKERVIPKIFLIDFGLSKTINNPSKLREFKKGAKTRKISGTSKYASLAYHNGHEAGPLDDLEAMGYVILELLNKKLPWTDVNFGRLKGTNQRWNDIAKSKRKTSLSALCKHLPIQFASFFDYVRNTPRHVTPDYNFLRGLFNKALFGEY